MSLNWFLGCLLPDRHMKLSLNGIQIEELDCSKLTWRVPCNGDALNEIAGMKSWLEATSGVDEATLSCMLAEPREALLPITGQENLVPRKRDRTLEPCASSSEEAYLSSAGSPCTGLSREERRRRRRATLKYRTAHATRERIRVEAFNAAFGSLRRLLPTLPPDKKLSKIEILRLAICYIAYLNHVLDS